MSKKRAKDPREIRALAWDGKLHDAYVTPEPGKGEHAFQAKWVKGSYGEESVRLLPENEIQSVDRPRKVPPGDVNVPQWWRVKGAETRSPHAESMGAPAGGSSRGGPPKRQRPDGSDESEGSGRPDVQGGCPVSACSGVRYAQARAPP